VKRVFLTLIAAAFAASLIGGAGGGKSAAAAQPKDPCASKTSKFARQQCESFTRSAPGDEYFGKMKMSFLGINNTFRDETIRSGDYTTDSGIISKVTFADDALRDWERKYPGDPQLARSYFLGIGVFKKIYTQPMQEKAWLYMQLIVQKFPNSYFGKIVKKQIVVGFTEHYFAVPAICPTPLPMATRLPRGYRPTPSPPPEATPEPTPTPGPNKPKIEILIPECVPPPTPTPEPTPEPTAAPALPAATPTPTPTPHR
jgi:hypothetical protein